MKAKIISFIVYLINSIILLINASALSHNGIWGGARNPFIDQLFLYSLGGLFWGPFICLINLAVGRIIYGIILILLGFFYISGIISVFPDHILNSLLLLLIYYCVLAFALFYPTRLKFNVLIFAVVLALDAFSTLVLLFGWNSGWK